MNQTKYAAQVELQRASIRRTAKSPMLLSRNVLVKVVEQKQPRKLKQKLHQKRKMPLFDASVAMLKRTRTIKGL